MEEIVLACELVYCKFYFSKELDIIFQLDCGSEIYKFFLQWAFNIVKLYVLGPIV